MSCPVRPSPKPHTLCLLLALDMVSVMAAADLLRLMQLHAQLSQDDVQPARLSVLPCDGVDCGIPARASDFALGDFITHLSSQYPQLEEADVGNEPAAKAPKASQPMDAAHIVNAAPDNSLLEQRAKARNVSNVHLQVKPLPGETYVMWNLTNKSFHSNLGGLGPDDGEQALRYFDVAKALDTEGNTRTLDLVVTTLTEYKASNIELNGVVSSGSGFGQINVKSNNTGMYSVDVQFDWYLAGTNTSVVLEKQFLTVYDVDGTRKSYETIVFYNRVEKAYLANNTELKQSGHLDYGLTLSAEGLTNNVPLPMNPETLTDEQKKRAVTVSYLEKGQFKLTLGVTGGRSGRNFAFAGHSLLADEGREVRTDPETPAPTWGRRDGPQRQTGQEEETPAPTSSPTTCADAGTCAIYEDPHIRVFDGVQISLLTAKTHMLADYGSGDMWLVRSSSISIQGRYLPDPDVLEANLFVRAVAVGGPFLRGNTLIIGPLTQEISWNGEPILQNQTSGFTAVAGDAFVRAKRHVGSHLVQDMTQTNAGVDVVLPFGVKLTVNRFKTHVNVFIQMPPAAGGQEGMCGNFNCHPGDDTLEMILMKRNPRVSPGDSLFQ